MHSSTGCLVPCETSTPAVTTTFLLLLLALHQPEHILLMVIVLRATYSNLLLQLTGAMKQCWQAELSLLDCMEAVLYMMTDDQAELSYIIHLRRYIATDSQA